MTFLSQFLHLLRHTETESPHIHRTLFAVHGCVVKKEVNSDLLSSRECVSQSRFCLKEKVLSHPRATDGCAVLV